MEENKSVDTKTYEERAQRATIISKPIANKKLAKKLSKLIRKAGKKKHHVFSGLSLVQTKIRKGEKGLAVIAGNASPIDVICHMPAVCEDREIPYVFLPSGRDLGAALGVKRSTLIILVKGGEDYKDLYDECFEEIKTLPPPEAMEG